MSNWEREVQREQQRVGEVVGKIGQEICDLERRLGGVKSEIVGIRKNFWDDLKVNFDNPDEALETDMAIRQQAEMLSERESLHRHAENRFSVLKKLEQSPYFARIDFVEDGEKAAERIYLGIGSFYDEDSEQFLVYDWRAPISSLYYDYSLGPATYEAPAGIITGSMELKRQFVIRNAEIRSMFDTGITIGDELLKQVLGKQSDAQMRSIVATIQKEQNRIIRNERSRLLIVQGAAGSGKTSAALQRVAYLLYRYRETLRADNIVLFSPNLMFNSYVSTVLPELGEENMQQTTFQEYLQHELGQTCCLEDPFTQMEYVLTAMDEPGCAVRMEGIRYKASLAFMQLIERYLECLGREGMIFNDVKFRGRVLISAEMIAAYFYSLSPSMSIPNRLQQTSEWLLKELDELAVAERSKAWVEEEIQLLDEEVYLRHYQKLRKKKQYTGDAFDDYEREQELLSTYVVNKRFKPLRRRVKRLYFVDGLGVYQRLFSEPGFALRFVDRDELPQQWAEICKQTVRRLERAELAYEDATPYLYLQERIEGFRTNVSVRHVFIDEAQDYSPFQFAFIRRLFPLSKMTVLGDVNQTIHAHAAHTGLTVLSSLYGEEETEKIVLNRSYRSTRPIVEFTSGLIDGGEAIRPFNREGSKPTVTQAADIDDLHSKIAARIRRLLADGYRTVAVICKTEQESRAAFRALRYACSARLIGKDTASFEPGVLIIPSYLAKGVEFDAVIIYNASREQFGRESERKLFYTACTRAMHELHLYCVGEVSPFVAAASPETYVKGE